MDPPAEPPPQPSDVQSDSPADPAEPSEAVVTLRDGRRIMGLLVSRSEDKIVLRIAGIETDFRMDGVDRVQVLAPVLERYRMMREAIDPGDIQQMLRLVEWLRAREKFDLALAEIDRALALTPQSAEARRVRALISGQIELAERARARRAAAPEQAAPDDAAAPPSDRPAKPFAVLTPQQINLIKVYEIDLRDPPNLLIKREAIARLMAEHAGNPLIPGTADGREAMFRMSPVQILDIMFRLQARDLYPEVEVVGQPRALRMFRDDVHRTWLMNACATTRCHGGEEAGRLYLRNQRVNSDETVYTNFLILDRYRLASGASLINYDDPERSPLLQAGLPRKDSLFPHPEVPGSNGRGDLWRPVFRASSDRRYVQAMDWIKAMYRPRPDYPVDYTPPRPVTPLPAAQQVGGSR
jgi:hypothetical protein